MGLGLIIQRRSHVPSGGVAGMLRNGWPESIGMPGRNGSEQVAGIDRNQWPECVGIRNIRWIPNYHIEPPLFNDPIKFD